jgi:hypothetical protein
MRHLFCKVHYLHHQVLGVSSTAGLQLKSDESRYIDEAGMTLDHREVNAAFSSA